MDIWYRMGSFLLIIMTYFFFGRARIRGGILKEMVLLDGIA